KRAAHCDCGSHALSVNASASTIQTRRKPMSSRRPSPRYRAPRYVLLSATLLGGACGAPEAVGTDSSAIRSEVLGGVAEVVARRYADPEVARVSYAAPLISAGGACSATMIGPNVLMTAAHCGPRTTETAVFRTYRNGGTTTSDAESFTCSFLYQTFDDTD